MKLLFLSFFICVSQFGFGQMTIDLGNDTVFCPPYPDTVPITNVLGTNLVIDQGTAPYTFTWFTEPYLIPYTSFTLFTSDYLNDTTIAEPILQGGRDTMEFFLTVTDATGQTATDSLVVYHSFFTVHLGYFVHYILEGDSIQLGCNNIGGGMGPLNYLWRPNHGLLDSTSVNFWTKPTVTTAYYPTVTDSVGCKAQAGFGCIVVVNYLNIIEALKSNSLITLFPNPTTGTIQLKDDQNQAINVQIFDATGKFVLEIKPVDFPFDMSGFTKGIYFLNIQTEVGVETRTVVLE
ncbi:MAG: T9SS type A sorting domain-containing protein [Putridiphycobacter sp.]|nr:T9SS type A sorting domain-containing protein [Putridiphycobacter sp.]